MRYHDCCLQPRCRSGSRLALSVVAACCGYDPLCLGFGALQPIDEGYSTANFECAGRRVGLVLYPDGGSRRLANLWPNNLWSRWNGPMYQIRSLFKFAFREEHRGVLSKSKRVTELESNVAVHLGERAIW